MIKLFLFIFILFEIAFSQNYDSLAKEIIKDGLQNGKSFEMLYELTTKIGHRLSGSLNADKSVEWGKNLMEQLGFENVHLESLMVPHWERGNFETCEIVASKSMKLKNYDLSICALGGSIATSENGITGKILEVKSFDELKQKKDIAKGKIIFFNRPMDKTKISTGEAYGGAVNQRGSGAIEAAKVGAIGVIVRSMTTRLDDEPHTGMMRYLDSIPKVPAVAISTIDAEFLSDLLKKDETIEVNIKLDCKTFEDAPSANVVGEITGSEFPNEIILIGGHLDSWDKGQGAHDDGAGIVHSIEALRLLKKFELRPKRTIRVVLFMNEENGLRGGIEYAKKNRGNEKHIVAIESDIGGFTPRGFGISCDSVQFQKFDKWSYLLESIDANHFKIGGGGADISELGKFGTILIGLRVDTHRYFDYHHSHNDTIDKVNERELELGAITIAIFTYIIANEGI